MDVLGDKTNNMDILSDKILAASNCFSAMLESVPDDADRRDITKQFFEDGIEELMANPIVPESFWRGHVVGVPNEFDFRPLQAALQALNKKERVDLETLLRGQPVASSASFQSPTRLVQFDQKKKSPDAESTVSGLTPPTIVSQGRSEAASRQPVRFALENELENLTVSESNVFVALNDGIGNSAGTGGQASEGSDEDVVRRGAVNDDDVGTAVTSIASSVAYTITEDVTMDSGEAVAPSAPGLFDNVDDIAACGGSVAQPTLGSLSRQENDNLF